MMENGFKTINYQPSSIFLKDMKQQKVFISGNEAMAEAAVRSGCAFYAGYPITPQNEITAAMCRRMAEEQRVFIQAESEVAAINMVLGAAAMGVRAMTSSSSPGISLKQEGISYIAGCRLPCMVINVMRSSPGLGGIGPSQSDYFQATKGGGHGDYRLIVLSPASVQEAYDLVIEGFNLADAYRVPAMILTDAIIGQMEEGCAFVEPKIIHPDPAAWALGDSTGRGQHIIRSFYLANEALAENNRILQKTYAEIREKEQRAAVSDTVSDCKVLLCAYGSMARIVSALLEEDSSLGLFRPISLWPFPEAALRKIIRQNKDLQQIVVIEASYGQMVEDVRLAVEGSIPVSFFGKAGGQIPHIDEVRAKVEEIKKGFLAKRNKIK